MNVLLFVTNFFLDTQRIEFGCGKFDDADGSIGERARIRDAYLKWSKGVYNDGCFMTDEADFPYRYETEELAISCTGRFMNGTDYLGKEYTGPLWPKPTRRP